MAIDTLAYAKDLEAAGADRAIAEAHARALTAHVLPDLVTKPDLASAVSELKALITDLKASIADAQFRILLGVVAIAGVSLAIAGTTLALVRLL
jgi:hypothetical protein